MAAGMEFCLLGPLVVRLDGAVMPVQPGKQRAMLAALLLSAGQAVPLDEMIEALWGTAPPPSARVSVRNYVKRLRQALGDTGRARISTQPRGYQISVAAGELDVTQFAELAGTAQAAVREGSWDRAAAQARAALALWRGEPLADVNSDVLAAREVPRLAEIRLQALDARIDADLHLGRQAEVIAELRGLTAVHPLREHLHALLMLALYRCGRQGEALAAYQHARLVVVEELGVEPGTGLRELHQRILTADPALVVAEAGPPAPGGPGPVVPRQLPAPVAHFAGRAGELATLTGLLDQAGGEAPGAVVISAIGGTGGVGKTALAVHWAHQVAERFPDGQLYVNLRGFGPSDPVTPAAALRGFLDALHVPAGQIPGGFAGQQALYRSLLAGRKMLILLDNALDGDQVRPLLPGSPASMVVVSSRNELAGLVAAEGARPLSLAVFTDAEAHELLARRIGRARLAAEPGVATELTALCARLPLALAVTAARASARPGFTLAAIAAELRDARSRLDALATGEQATDVRAVFSWSYRSLQAPAARMFRLLGLHPGPDVTAPAAASLAALPSGQAGGLLRELTRCHLLAEPVPGRYVLHDLLRAYATEQAHAEDGEPDCRAAIHRMLDHYLHTAYAASSALYPARDPIPLCEQPPAAEPEHITGHDRALAWLRAEHRVLLNVIIQAARDGFDQHALELPETLATYLDRHGHWHDCLTSQHTSLAAAQRMADPAGQARAHRFIGRAYVRLRRYQEGYRQLTRAMELYQDLGDHLGQARSHLAIALAAGGEGRHHAALQHARRALPHYLSAGHRAGQATALTEIGWYHCKAGQPEQALIPGQRGLDLNRELGNRDGEAESWSGLGYACHRLARHTEAISCYQQALGLLGELGHTYHQASVLDYLGDTHRAAGSPRAARETWLAALAILDDLHHPDADQVRAKLQDIGAVPPG